MVNLLFCQYRKYQNKTDVNQSLNKLRAKLLYFSEYLALFSMTQAFSSKKNSLLFTSSRELLVRTYLTIESCSIFQRNGMVRLCAPHLTDTSEILPTYSLIRTAASSNSPPKERLGGMCRVWRGNLRPSFPVRGKFFGFSSFHLRKVTFYSYFGICFPAFIGRLQTVVARIVELKVFVHFAGKSVRDSYRNKTFEFNCNLQKCNGFF